MSKIVDPDFLVLNTEIGYNPTGRVINLKQLGNLSSDGVTMQAVYSKTKEIWRTDETLIKYPFPLVAITKNQFDFVNGWDFSGDSSRYLIRDAGWSVRDASNNSSSEWAGIVSLGSLGTGDQVYFIQSGHALANIQNFQLPGPVNQSIKIYDSGNAFNARTFFKMFAREYGKTYDNAELADIGLTALEYTSYAFPLQNSTDLKISISDVGVTGTAPHSGMSMSFYTGTFPRSIGGNTYLFNKLITGNNGTTQQIYEFAQNRLRQGIDIDAGPGTGIGKISNELLSFLGDTLQTAQGVYVDGFDPVYTNAIDFYDVSGVKRTFPFVANFQVVFNSNLIADPSAAFRVFFSSGYGSNGAIIARSTTNAPMSGYVNGLPSTGYSFDWDNYSYPGHIAGTTANITVVALGLSGAQYTSSAGTIARSTSNAVNLQSSLERNYTNP